MPSWGIRRPDRSHDGKTQLDHAIYSAWTRTAKDPDTAMADWLRDGTPMGIEAEATPVGVFPEVYEKVDDSIQRQLEF